MNWVACVLMVIAAVLFLLDAFWTYNPRPKLPAIALGLFFFVSGVMVQLLATSHTWHF